MHALLLCNALFSCPPPFCFCFCLCLLFPPPLEMLFPPRRLRRIFLGRACEILHRRGAVFAGIVLLPMLRGAEGFCFCCGGTLPPLLSKYFSCIVHPWKCYPLPCRCSHNVVVSMRGTTPCSAQSFWSAGTIILAWKGADDMTVDVGCVDSDGGIGWTEDVVVFVRICFAGGGKELHPITPPPRVWTAC